MPRLCSALVGSLILTTGILASAQVVALSSGAGQTIVIPPSGQAVPGARTPPAPPRDNPQTKPGTATLSGRVFAGDSGQPLRKAQVRITSSELRENRLATSDVNGRYEFKELPAGRYNLNAAKGSYVSLAYGQLRPNEPGKPLEILDGQTIEKVDFALPRGSLITGHVLDEFGDPVVDVQVAPMRQQYVQGRRRLLSSGRTATTNDIGEFRLFGLPPGQYYVSATLRSINLAQTDSTDRSGYAPTYYPGTGNVAEAQRLTLGLGETINDINMTLVQTRTAKASGTAVDSAGRPLTNALIIVGQRDGGLGSSISSGAQTRPDGSFSISNLAPGDYVFRALGGNSSSGEVAVANVTVAGDDVTGVRLVGTRPTLGTGRVVGDPATIQSLQPATIRLGMQQIDFDDSPLSGGGSMKVNDDFTLEVRSQLGRYAIRMAGTPGVSLKAVRVNGADVTDSGIEFKPNEDVSGIEVELTNKVSEVSGLVTNSRGDAIKDYSVVFFAQDRDRWGNRSRFFGTGRPDQDGRFKVRSLPPGDYNAVALDYIEPGQETDPEFLDRIQSRVARLSLGEGETKVLDLKLSTAP